MRYIIVTDSGCDVPKDIVEKYQIEVVPMHVSLGDETFDDYTIPVSKVYEHYDKTGELPKTSGSTPEDNRKKYAGIRETYPDTPIIHIAYSAVTTVSYNSARIAAEDFDNIYIVDSKNVTAGAAIIVKAAAEFIEENQEATPEDVVAYVEDVRERTRLVFMPETLDYLKAGGRVSNASFLVASLLKIHPSIILEDGYLIASKKYRGNFDRSTGKMLDDFFALGEYEETTLTVGGTEGFSTTSLENAKEKLKKLGYNLAYVFTAGAVISSHGGPGTFGIAGILKA